MLVELASWMLVRVFGFVVDKTAVVLGALVSIE